jgi:hypothetical protein
MSRSSETKIDRLIYGFVAVRMLIDVIIAAAISFQTDSLITGGGFWILCWVFYLLLFFGTRTDTFHGRDGQKVYRWREPAGWWFVLGFIVLLHLTITLLFALLVVDWPSI